MEPHRSDTMESSDLIAAGRVSLEIPEEAALTPLCISTVGYSELTGCVDRLLGLSTPNKALLSTAAGLEANGLHEEDGSVGTPSYPEYKHLSGEDGHAWDMTSLVLWHRMMLALLVQAEGVQRSAQMYSNDADRSRYLLQQFQIDTGCDAHLSAWYLPHAAWHYPTALTAWHHDMHQLLLSRARSPPSNPRTPFPSYLLTRKQQNIDTVRRKAAEAEKAAFIASAPTPQPGTMDAMARHHRRVKFQALTQLDSKAANRFLTAGNWDVAKALDVYLTESVVKEELPVVGAEVAGVFRDAALWRKRAGKKMVEVGIQVPSDGNDEPHAGNGWPAACLAALNLQPGRRVADGNTIHSPTDSINSEQVFAEHMKDSYMPDTPSSASTLGESHLAAPHTRSSFEPERLTLIESHVESDTTGSEREGPIPQHPDPSRSPGPGAWQSFHTGSSSGQRLMRSTTSFRSNASWAIDTAFEQPGPGAFLTGPKLLEAMGPPPLAAPHHSIGSIDSIQSVPQAPVHPWGAPRNATLQVSTPSFSDVYLPEAGGGAGIPHPSHGTDTDPTPNSPAGASHAAGVPASRQLHTDSSQLPRSGAFTEYITPAETGPDSGPDRAAIAAVAVALQASMQQHVPEVHSRTVVTSTPGQLSPPQAVPPAPAPVAVQEMSLAAAIHASLAADPAVQPTDGYSPHSPLAAAIQASLAADLAVQPTDGYSPRSPLAAALQAVPAGILTTSGSTTHSNESNNFFPPTAALSVHVPPVSPRTIVSPASHSSPIRSEGPQQGGEPVTPRGGLPASLATPPFPDVGETVFQPVFPAHSGEIPSYATEVIHTHALAEEGLLDDDESYPLSPADSAPLPQDEAEEPPTLKVWTKGAQAQQTQSSGQDSAAETQPADSLAETKLATGTAEGAVGVQALQDATGVDVRGSVVQESHSDVTRTQPDVEVHVTTPRASPPPHAQELVLKPIIPHGASFDSSPPPMPSVTLSHVSPHTGTTSGHNGSTSSAGREGEGSIASPAHSSTRARQQGVLPGGEDDARRYRQEAAAVSGAAGTTATEALSPSAGDGVKEKDGNKTLGVEQYFTTSLRNWVDPVPHLLTSPLAKGISAPGGLSEVVAPLGTTELTDDMCEPPPPTGTMELPPLPEDSPLVAAIKSSSSQPGGQFPPRHSGSIVEVPLGRVESLTSSRSSHIQGGSVGSHIQGGSVGSHIQGGSVGSHIQGGSIGSPISSLQYTSSLTSTVGPGQQVRTSITNAGLLVMDYPAPTRSISTPSAWQNVGSHTPSHASLSPSVGYDTGPIVPTPPQLSHSSSLHYRSLEDILDSVSTGGSGHHAQPTSSSQLSPLNVLSSSHGQMSAAAPHLPNNSHSHMGVAAPNLHGSSHGHMDAPPELQRSSTLPYRSVAAFDNDFTLAGVTGGRGQPDGPVRTGTLERVYSMNNSRAAMPYSTDPGMAHDGYRTASHGNPPPPLRHNTGSTVQHGMGPGTAVHSGTGVAVHAGMGAAVHTGIGAAVHAGMGTGVHAGTGAGVHAGMGASVHAGTGAGVHAGPPGSFASRGGAPPASNTSPPGSTIAPGSMAQSVQSAYGDVPGQYTQPTGSTTTTWMRSSSSRALPPFLPDSTPDYAAHTGHPSPSKSSHYSQMPQRSSSTDLNLLRTQSSVGGGGGGYVGVTGAGLATLREGILPPPKGLPGGAGLLPSASGQLQQGVPAAFTAASTGERPRERLQAIDSFDHPEWDAGRKKSTTNLDDLDIPNWF